MSQKGGGAKEFFHFLVGETLKGGRKFSGGGEPTLEETMDEINDFFHQQALILVMERVCGKFQVIIFTLAQVITILGILLG